MLKSKLELLYQTFFNYFLKKDGYNNKTHIVASAVSTLVYVLTIFSCLGIINIFTHDLLHFKIEKPKSWLLVFIVMFAVYLFHFYGLKFSKKGENEDGSFNLSGKSYKSTLKFALGVMVAFFFFTILNKLIQNL